MRKKTAAAIVSGAFVVALALPTAAFAAPQCGFENRVAMGQGRGFAAAAESVQGAFDRMHGRAYVDADADGVCDYYAVGGGRGQGYCRRERRRHLR